MKIRNTTQVAIVIGSLLAGKDCFALTAITSFQVTATVTDACTVNATPLGFGTFAAGGAVVDSGSFVNVTCNLGTGYTIALDSGARSVDFNPRKMDNGGGVLLNYNLYTDAGRTTVWGDGTGSTQTQAGTGTGVSQPYTVYGRIFSGQEVTGGPYSDTINVTVTYS